MMDLDFNTVGALVYPIAKLGVDFTVDFLKKIWNPEKNPHTEESPIEGNPHAESNPTDNNREAAWHLYVEMETRITTQSLAPGQAR